MAVLKRIIARVGSTGESANAGWVCPHCHQQSELELVQGRLVCTLCGKAPQE